MTLFAIPTATEDPFWTQVTGLSGVDYTLTFVYNQREDVYYLSLGTSTGVDIVRGLKLVTNWPLLTGLQDERLPPGTLIVLSNTTDDSPPGFGELGPEKRCELIYDDGET